MKNLRTELNFSNKTLLALFVSSIIGALNQYFSVINIQYSLAVTSMDDGPVVPYLLTKRMDLFFQDYWSISWWQLRWTSSSKWIPALLGYLSIDINREMLQVIFLASQGIFLGLGVYVLSYSIIKNRTYSILLVIFFCITRPHFNNWAYYGDQEFMPYVTWLALGPLMLGMGLNILKRKNLAILFVAFGSSMHVSMGIVFGLAIFILNSVIDYESVKKIKIFRNAKILIGPIIFFTVGYLSLITISINYENVEDQKTLLLNQHYRAWIISPSEKSYLLTIQTLLMSLTLIGIIYSLTKLFRVEKIFSYNVFFKFIIIINVMFYFLQALFYSLGFIKLASVSWGRISLILILSLYIVILDIVYNQIIIQKNFTVQNKVILFCTVGIFIFGSFLSLAIYLTLLILIQFRENNDVYNGFRITKFFKRDLIFNLIILFTIIIIKFIIDLRINEIFKQLINVILNFDGFKTILYLVYELLLDSPQSNINLRIFSLKTFNITFLLILLGYIFLNIRFIKIITILIIFCVTYIGIQNKILDTQNRIQRFASYKDIQLWAKNNSKIGETFVVEQGISTYGAWSSLSERPRLITSLKEGQQYLYTKRNRLRNQERDEILLKIKNNNFLTFSDEYYQTFRERWNFAYIVQQNDEINLEKLKKVYSNKDYSIFKM